MALKDIFTMVKADRYTADGCEVLNKAREADVEDRRYNIGEISEKTGLQKTANGWVKPKKGNGGSAKKDASGTTKMTPEQKSKWEAKAANSSETTASLRNFISSMSKPEAKANPHADEIVEIYKKELAKRENDPGYRPEKVYSDTPSESKPAVGWEETQMASGKIYDTPDRTYRIIERNDWKTGEKTFDIRDLKNMRADDIKGIKTLEEAKRIVAENKANNKKEAEAALKKQNAAPRTLTGDTRIRVRKA